MKNVSLAVTIMRDEASDQFRWQVVCKAEGRTHEFSGFERRGVDARKVAAHACALCVTTDGLEVQTKEW